MKTQITYEAVRDFLNKDPYRFRTGAQKPEIDGEKSLITYSSIEKRLIVSVGGEMFYFSWSGESNSWCN